ncbi:prefoldin subunit 1-like [Petromyzon marinus]|uniref:prefoldin subunit 1-like n=1 Tax=Petromyzon marinus TaxID=7757 RepID=UPI003F7247D1
MAALPVDEELQKAFVELQATALSTQQQVRQCEAQHEALLRVHKRATLTQAELGALPADSRAYQPVGRVFVLQTQHYLLDSLAEKASTSSLKMKDLENKKFYLEKNLKEAEDNIREMLVSRRSH